jgi:enoyl-CoA hydratase/carnithine racemase
MFPEPRRHFCVARDCRGVVDVALDVPGRAYNVLADDGIAELQTLVDQWERDPTVRLVLFCSAKESGFFAGADLREVAAIRSPQTADQFSTIGQKLLERIERLDVPSVAAIHGPCLGGGLELALACRYRLARDDAQTRLGLPEVELGLSCAWGGTQRLPQRVGLSAALGMILGGRKVSPREAARMGLVDEIFPPPRFAAGVERFVSDRLEGRPWRRRQPGPWARLRDRTRLGQRIVLHEARRTARRGPDQPALAASADRLRRRHPQHAQPAEPLDHLAGDLRPAVDFGRVELRVAERPEFRQRRVDLRPLLVRQPGIRQQQIVRQPSVEQFFGQAAALRSGEEQFFRLADLLLPPPILGRRAAYCVTHGSPHVLFPSPPFGHRGPRCSRNAAKPPWASSLSRARWWNSNAR